MSVNMSPVPNTPIDIPADEKTIRLDEINRLIAILEQRKSEL
jgi:hypothetical protein